MTPAEAIVAAALAMPGAGGHLDDAAKRAAWLGTIAYAIDSAAERATCTGAWNATDATICQRVWPGTATELRASLLVEGYFESRLLERIQAGRCRKDECDPVVLPDGRVFHLARSAWQIQAQGQIGRREWWTLAGTSSVAVSDAAWAAARVLANSRRRCAGGRGGTRWIAPMVSAYAGAGCGWGGARTRALLVERVIAKFEKAQHEH